MKGADAWATATSAEFGSSAMLGAFVLFCRIGGCLMIAPGVSNVQIPTQVRLFVAVAVTLALSPLLIGQAPLKHLGDDPLAMLRLIVMEGLIGAMIGGLGRAFFSALESLATVAGASARPRQRRSASNSTRAKSSPPLATRRDAGGDGVSCSRRTSIGRSFAGSSLRTTPSRCKVDFDPAYTVRHLGAVLGQSFLVAVRVASPFFLYSVIANFALTLINRVTPQIPMFFVGAAVRRRRRPGAVLFRRQGRARPIHGRFRALG